MQRIFKSTELNDKKSDATNGSLQDRLKMTLMKKFPIEVLDDVQLCQTKDRVITIGYLVSRIKMRMMPSDYQVLLQSVREAYHGLNDVVPQYIKTSGSDIRYFQIVVPEEEAQSVIDKIEALNPKHSPR